MKLKIAFPFPVIVGDDGCSVVVHLDPFTTGMPVPDIDQEPGFTGLDDLSEAAYDRVVGAVLETARAELRTAWVRELITVHYVTAPIEEVPSPKIGRRRA